MNLKTLNRYYEEGWLIKQIHPTLPLTIWNYSQTTQYEGKWDKITLQCRGLVTWSNQNEVVARPFRKFFNMEEGKHTPTEEFEVYEKMDGSLIIAFYMWGEWVVASRGSFTSEQALAAKKLLDNMNTFTLSIGATYLFEYTAPWNRIVVDYGDKENLTLLGAIDTDTGAEAPYESLQYIGDQLGCDVVKKYDGIKDYSTLKNMIRNNAEGFVVRFSNGDRMKIKGEEYIRLHKIMTNLSTTSVWEVLSSGGNMEDLLVNVPDEFYDKIKEYVKDLAIRFDNIRKDYIQYYTDIVFKVGIENRKLFAEEAKRYNHPSILFNLLNEKDINSIIWKIIKPEFKKL
jgi:RNA ligase